MTGPAATALHVVIAGGGVAGAECALGLHDLAGDRVTTTLVVDRPDLHYRPLSIAEPFGGAPARRYPLAELARHAGAQLRDGAAQQVDAEAHELVLRSGQRVPYDVLVVALGTVQLRLPELPDAIDPLDGGALRALRDELQAGATDSVAIVLPAGPHWVLPGYELAMMLARDARAGGTATVRVVTQERTPLELFGARAAAAVAAALEEAGVEVVTDTSVGAGHAVPRVVRESHRVIALPELHGPALAGLPADDAGFIRVGAHGLVLGVDDVYAAGDCTDVPVKQGGVASQQADTVAEEIAARAGAAVAPRERHLLLRGRLLTGGPPTWLRRDASDPHDEGVAADHALWWPPDKIAGRWLAPYLAACDDTAAGLPHEASHGRPLAVPTSAPHMPVPRNLDLLGDPPARDAR